MIFDRAQTWIIPGVIYNINPTHKNNQGCQASPGPFGCLTCPLAQCLYDTTDPRLCDGSGQTVENLSTGRGSGIFRCSVCDRPDIEVEQIGRGHYMARNHYPRPRIEVSA